MYVKRGVKIWLLLSSIIVIMDSFYCLNRPHTLKGGIYHHYFSLYEHYVRHDSLYGNNQDLLVPVVAYLNLAEVAITVIGFLFTFSASKGNQVKGALLFLIASAFVFWKTVIYLIYDW